jgi:hypothetical protein
VEQFAGISGQAETGHCFLMVNFTTYGFKLWKNQLKIVLKHNKSRILTIGRTANLTVPHKGRGSCQYRDLVAVGPFGAYFSTQSSSCNGY